MQTVIRQPGNRVLGARRAPEQFAETSTVTVPFQSISGSRLDEVCIARCSNLVCGAIFLTGGSGQHQARKPA